MATRKTSANPEFLYISVDKIVVLEQVRSNIDIETDSFKSLMQSIKDKGILEPLIVTGQDDGTYVLICGERRLVAARQLGLETVPIRVIEAGKELGDTIPAGRPKSHRPGERHTHIYSGKTSGQGV